MIVVSDTTPRSDYIKRVTVDDTDRVDFIRRVTGLDRGETEAIVYADFKRAISLLLKWRKQWRVLKYLTGISVKDCCGTH